MKETLIDNRYRVEVSIIDCQFDEPVEIARESFNVSSQIPALDAQPVSLFVIDQVKENNAYSCDKLEHNHNNGEGLPCHED